MSDGRKRRDKCGADESVYNSGGGGEQRRSVRSRGLQESAGFRLIPVRPATCGDARPSYRRSEHLGLQVQGFCCRLQQRPSSGRGTHGGTAQSRGGGDEKLLAVGSWKSPDIQPAETPTTSSNSEGPSRHGPPGATLVSELHLYLPSSLCDEEEPDSEAEETRSPEEDAGASGM